MYKLLNLIFHIDKTKFSVNSVSNYFLKSLSEPLIKDDITDKRMMKNTLAG